MTERNFWTPTDEALTWSRGYLGTVQRASVRLSSHNNKGAARIGLRVARYVDLCSIRLAMLLDGLTAKQRAALGTLPFLLHVNNQQLPGFVNSKSPIVGIRGFALNEMLERCGRLSLSKEISEFITDVERPFIESVFLSSAVGTIGQRQTRTVRVYLVANIRSLGAVPLQHLQDRLDDLSRWYVHANLDVEFTLLDPVWTARGHFGDPHGDVAQGVLRLDHFYQRSFLMCGGIPTFWCTAPGTSLEQYKKAASMIQRVDFEAELFFVDLGAVLLPKPAVRRRAMLGLLNHRTESPLDFLFGLIQLTFGANTSLSLSEHLKLALFKHGARPEVADRYLFAFDCAMVVLNHHRHWQGANVLRDFVLAKIAIRAHKTTYSHPAFVGELALGEGLITKWGWDSTTLQLTDHLDSLNRIFHLYIHKRLNEFVIGLYRTLSDAAKDKKGRFDQTEFTLLGRRLLAHFSPKNTRLGVHYAYAFHEDISRNVISIQKTETEDDKTLWTVLAGQTSSELGRMVEVWQGKSLLNGLGWVAASGVYRSTSTLKFDALSSRMGRGFVDDILNEISDMTSELDPLVVGAKHFSEIPTLQRAIIILNFEDFEHPVEDVRTGRKHYLPSNWDILNYGREQESRLRDVAVISTDSWDVCSLRRVKGKDAIRHALKWVYSGRSYTHGKFKAPVVFAPDGREHRAGQDRLLQLILKVEALFEPALRIDECSSFLYEVGNRFQVLQRRGDTVHCFQTSDLSRAVRLATPSHMPIKQLQFDGLAPSLNLVNLLRERANRDQDVEVFMVWRKGPIDSELFVLDSTQRIYRATAHSKRFDSLFVGTMRRLIYILRDRAHDMRTLRKLLKVYEAKDGVSGQTGVQLADDTVRALRYVGAHPPNALQITVGGDLADGRNGLYYQVDDTVFKASESGRRFTLECVLHALETVSKSSETAFKIERSDVEFIRAEKSSATDAVRHLRMMDICQSQLYRTVGHLKAGGKSILNSSNKFGREGLHA